MKKLIAAIVVIIAMGIVFYNSSTYVIYKVDSALSLIDQIISDLEDDNYEGATSKLNDLKKEMDTTAPTLQKILVHENVEELMRAIDEALVYCKYKVKSEAIKEMVGAQYYLNSLKEVEVFSLKTIF